MLRLIVNEGHLEFQNGFNAFPYPVTRYHGEQWEQVGSDLLCGIADGFPDVGIVVTGNSATVTSETLKHVTRDGNGNRRPTGDGWVSIDDDDKQCKAIYSYSESHGWLFVPNCRESVEDVISWTMWAGSGEQGFRATCFLGIREFRTRLESESWQGKANGLARLVREHCLDKALFQTESGPGTWFAYPGSIEISHLVRLADPVIARINTELTD